MLRHAFGTLGGHKYLNMIMFGCRSEYLNESAEMLKTKVPKLTNITKEKKFKIFETPQKYFYEKNTFEGQPHTSKHNVRVTPN